jgi:hypothetical protein
MMLARDVKLLKTIGTQPPHHPPTLPKGIPPQFPSTTPAKPFTAVDLPKVCYLITDRSAKIVTQPAAIGSPDRVLSLFRTARWQSAMAGRGGTSKSTHSD